MDYKLFDFDLKEITSEGVIEGYAAVFNNVDFGGDKIIPGAFADTIKRTGGKIPILSDHQVHIGWGMEAAEDSKGLMVKGKLDLNVQAARERYSLAKTGHDLGAKMGMSIGYSARKPAWENDVRILSKIDLHEYSIVSFPMNEKARVTALKQADDKRIRQIDGAIFYDIENVDNFERSGFKSAPVSLGARPFYTVITGLHRGGARKTQGYRFDTADGWTLATAGAAAASGLMEKSTEGGESCYFIGSLAVTARDMERLLRDAGLSNTKAKAMASIAFGGRRDDGSNAEIKAALEALKDVFGKK